jgi:hypothetical protein
MNDPATRVVLLSLDAVGHDVISPEITPHLWALREKGGWAPQGGRCDVPAVTYVSHATLTTGTRPAKTWHHLKPRCLADSGTVPGWAGQAQVRTPTLFDTLGDAGLRTAAVCGDQNLVQIMGAVVAETIGHLVASYRGHRDVLGRLPVNDAIRKPPARFHFGRGPDVPFRPSHETDTWVTTMAPNHPLTLASYTAADALVGEVVEALRPDWDRLSSSSYQITVWRA